MSQLLGYEVSSYDPDVPGQWKRRFSLLYSFQVPDAIRQLLNHGYDYDTIMIEFRGEQIAEEEEIEYFPPQLRPSKQP